MSRAEARSARSVELSDVLVVMVKESVASKSTRAGSWSSTHIWEVDSVMWVIDDSSSSFSELAKSRVRADDRSGWALVLPLSLPLRRWMMRFKYLKGVRILLERRIGAIL